VNDNSNYMSVIATPVNEPSARPHNNLARNLQTNNANTSLSSPGGGAYYLYNGGCADGGGFGSVGAACGGGVVVDSGLSGGVNVYGCGSGGGGYGGGYGAEYG
jgi:hypothetical protein